MRRRKVLEVQLEAIVKMLVFWRDASQCVLVDIDGGRCRGKLNWGHFIPRARSKYLKYDLATFVQCDAHNLIHDSRKTGGGDPIFGLWFASRFGLDALERISQVQREHIGDKYTVPELEELLAHYDELYQDRFYADLTTESLVERGFYGEIIKDAWSKR
uniref:Uncharacterized protein n=1 Tax=viral metagenome TaxID=1070528 RepID=A0A6M3LTC2_9ZZZZ